MGYVLRARSRAGEGPPLRATILSHLQPPHLPSKLLLRPLTSTPNSAQQPEGYFLKPKPDSVTKGHRNYHKPHCALPLPTGPKQSSCPSPSPSQPLPSFQGSHCSCLRAFALKHLSSMILDFKQKGNPVTSWAPGLFQPPTLPPPSHETHSGS